MKVLVCGSRSWTNLDMIHQALVSFKATEVIHGGAIGADALGGIAAAKLGLPVKIYPADWNKLGKKAGPIRNQEMLDKEHPDLVLAFWDMTSRGTWDMIKRSRKGGYDTRIIHEGIRTEV